MGLHDSGFSELSPLASSSSLIPHSSPTPPHHRSGTHPRRPFQSSMPTPERNSTAQTSVPEPSSRPLDGIRVPEQIPCPWTELAFSEQNSCLRTELAFSEQNSCSLSRRLLPNCRIPRTEHTPARPGTRPLRNDAAASETGRESRGGRLIPEGPSRSTIDHQPSAIGHHRSVGKPSSTSASTSEGSMPDPR